MNLMQIQVNGHCSSSREKKGCSAPIEQLFGCYAAIDNIQY